MNKYLMLLSILLLFGCSASQESSETDLSNYNLLEYVPSKEGTFREYIQYGTEKEGGIISRDFLTSITQEKLSEEITVNHYDFDYSVFFSDDSSQIIEQKRLYSANENRIVHNSTSSEDPFLSALQNINPSESIILSKTMKWEKNKEQNAEVTAIGIDVLTKLGEFSNCIEVISTVTYENMKGMQIKEYHCPKVGEVVSYFKPSNSDDFELYSELIYVSIPGEKELGEQYLIGTPSTEESTAVEEVIENSTTDEENPIATLVSGSLPIVTGKVSTLNFNDYRDRVNALSLEGMGYYILHNPLNFDESESEILLEFDEGITVLVEKDTYLVKEIAVKHDYINETSYIYANYLIMGISPEVTVEEAQDILHPKVEGTTGEVLDFSIGQYLENGHFNFLAVVY